MPIAIDIAGAHPTTETCLEALQWLQERREFHSILDMGCGNGILSLAAASIWGAPALAVDISEKAILDTKANIAAHGLEALITALRNDGFSHPAIGTRTPYDLIIFNLLAEQHVSMARQLRAHLAVGGVCVASGILAWKAAEVEIAYRQTGLEILHRIAHQPWLTYIMECGPGAIIS